MADQTLLQRSRVSKKWSRRRRLDPDATFFEKVKKDDGDGCWNWLGSLFPNGYGQGYHPRFRTRYAHRISYEILVGPIRNPLEIDHLCRNRACVNPAHLEAVTRSVNLRRGFTLPAIHAEKTHCIHGHEFTPRNTMRNKKGHRECRECNLVRRRVKTKRRLMA